MSAAQPLSQAAQVIEFDPTLRLEIASRIAAGMMANPEVFAWPAWKTEAAHAAMQMADKLILIAYTGGA